jgi:L-fuconolactonase
LSVTILKTLRKRNVIVDSHQHFWNYQHTRDAWIDDSMAVLKRDFGPSELLQLMRANGVDRCVAVQADPSEEETRFLLSLADTHDGIAGVVGWVDLCAQNAADRLERFAQHPKFKGVRHLVQSEPDPDFMLRADFKRGIKALAALGLTYDLLIKPHQMPAAIALVKAFPDQPFVLDHLGKPQSHNGLDQQWARELFDLAAHPNVYAKLSGLVTETENFRFTKHQFKPLLDTALEAFGPERLLFGSDWPVCLLAASYGEVLGIVKEFIAELSSDQQAAIMGNNARYFYQL